MVAVDALETGVRQTQPQGCLRQLGPDEDNIPRPPRVKKKVTLMCAPPSTMQRSVGFPLLAKKRRRSDWELVEQRRQQQKVRCLMLSTGIAATLGAAVAVTAAWLGRSGVLPPDIAARLLVLACLSCALADN